MAVWDPARYLQFADDRARPFLDLLAQIPGVPATIYDLGCGPGHLTRHLRARWPEADVLGVDSSAEMVEQAIIDNMDARANYDVVDVADWVPTRPADLMISNAMLQWVPDQFAVIDRLLGFLADVGTFAVQVPNNHDSPTHATLRELAATEPYAEHLASVVPLPAIPPTDHLDFFSERGFTVNAWETTYLHVLAGEDPVFDWIAGTGARPFLQGLPDGLRKRFTADLKERFRAAFPHRACGTVLPFRRTFAVATRP